MGRILVIRGGAIGDFVLTLPVLAALRAAFPEVRVEVLGYPHIARLALAGGLAHAVHPIESRPLAGFFARQGTLDDGVANLLAGFAVIVSFLYDPDDIFRTNVGRCTQAQFIAGPHRPLESASAHAADTFLSALEKLAIFDADGTPALPVQPLTPGPGPWLAAHPGSGSESKNWPESRWAELLERTLRETDVRLLLVGGEAEGDRLGRLARPLPTDRVHIARGRPLDELAGLLRGCQAFVGHDSGITHLAAAVGRPCTVLWGPTRPEVWRPRGPLVHLVRSPGGLPSLRAEDAWNTLHPLIAATGATPG